MVKAVEEAAHEPVAARIDRLEAADAGKRVRQVAPPAAREQQLGQGPREAFEHVNLRLRCRAGQFGGSETARCARPDDGYLVVLHNPEKPNAR